MNKKTLLILATIPLCAIGCKRNTLESEASNTAYNMKVKTYDCLYNNAAVSADISSNKIDLVYKHNHNAVKPSETIDEQYTISLNDVYTMFFTKIGGLNRYNSSEENYEFKSQTFLNRLTTRGYVQFDSTRLERKPLNAKFDFDNMGTIDSLSLYLNHAKVDSESEPVYGGYFNFAESKEKLEKIKIDLNDEYKIMPKNIELRFKNLIDNIDKNPKRRMSIADLSDYFIVQKLADVLCGSGLGKIAKSINDYINHNEEEKSNAIKEIEQKIEAMNSTEAGQVLTMGYDDEKKLHYDINFNHEKLNKYLNTNVFISGEISFTLKADSDGRVGSFEFNTKNLKSSDAYTLSFDSSKSIKFNDFNLYINGSITYDESYESFADLVNTITSSNFEAFNL